RLFTSRGVGEARKKQTACPTGVPAMVEVLNGATIGGGQPGRLNRGSVKFAFACWARMYAYDCRWVLSLMPRDWKPAVIEFPRATYRSKSGIGGSSGSTIFWSSAAHPASSAAPTRATPADLHVESFISFSPVVRAREKRRSMVSTSSSSSAGRTEAVDERQTEDVRVRREHTDVHLV